VHRVKENVEYEEALVGVTVELPGALVTGDRVEF
jgi:hypothetical protein